MDEQTPTVVQVSISPGGIPKLPLESVEVGLEGLAGDGHNHEKHCTPLQAVCLIDVEDIDALHAEGFDVHPGAVGENVTCRSLQVDELEIGDRLRFSGGLEIEITKRRKPCYVLDAIDPELKKAIAGRCGTYGKVITPATLRAGETIEINRAASVTR